MVVSKDLEAFVLPSSLKRLRRRLASRIDLCCLLKGGIPISISEFNQDKELPPVLKEPLEEEQFPLIAKVLRYKGVSFPRERWQVQDLIALMAVGAGIEVNKRLDQDNRTRFKRESIDVGLAQVDYSQRLVGFVFEVDKLTFYGISFVPYTDSLPSYNGIAAFIAVTTKVNGEERNLKPALAYDNFLIQETGFLSVSGFEMIDFVAMQIKSIS